MSDASQGPGWWQASDGRWYPPTAVPGPEMGPATPYGVPVPGPYGYPYPQSPHGTRSGLPSVSGLATASLVLGIIAAIPCCSVNHLGALVGLPLGIVALLRINRGEADPAPRGQAIAGIVLSSIGLAIGVVALALIIVSANADPNSMAATGPVA